MTEANDYSLQQWLISKGADIALDGMAGSATRNAIMQIFSNLTAPGITQEQEQRIASYLDVTLKQLRAVATVESAGSAFDGNGRPKILFERHIMDRLTAGRFSVTAWSNPDGGGYSESSWDKLTAAACADFWAAFSSASWGKFQVMGMHWQAMGYDSPHELALSTVESELGHYLLLSNFITMSGLRDEMAALSTAPDECRPFAKGYNGSEYEENNYHVKLAQAME